MLVEPTNAQAPTIAQASTMARGATTPQLPIPRGPTIGQVSTTIQASAISAPKAGPPLPQGTLRIALPGQIASRSFELKRPPSHGSLFEVRNARMQKIVRERVGNHESMARL